MRDIKKMFREIFYLLISKNYYFLRVFSNAKHVSSNSLGNGIVELKKKSPLGAKGQKIEIPIDQVIFKHVIRNGSWEMEESRFLSNGLIRVCKVFNRVLFLDIGANSGLVSLQVMNLARTTNSLIAIEPLQRNFHALTYNLQTISSTNKVNLINVAISEKDGVETIFSEVSNLGNSSLIREVVPSRQRTEEVVKCIQAETFFAELIGKFDAIVLKIDTQGFDAAILSRMPQKLWDQVSDMVIEIWAIPQVKEEDILAVSEFLNVFEYVAWQPESQEKLQLSEVVEFWLSRKETSRNLFVRRKIPDIGNIQALN